MQRVDGLKRECADGNCSKRKEREYSVNKNRVNWVEGNPIESICTLLKSFNRAPITKNGKLRFIESQDYQVILDVLNSYF